MTGAPPTNAELARGIEQVAMLAEAILGMLATDAEAYGCRWDAMIRNGATEGLVALYGPRVIAEAEKITAEGVADHFGRSLRELERKASARAV